MTEISTDEWYSISDAIKLNEKAVLKAHGITYGKVADNRRRIEVTEPWSVKRVQGTDKKVMRGDRLMKYLLYRE